MKKKNIIVISMLTVALFGCSYSHSNNKPTRKAFDYISVMGIDDRPKSDYADYKIRKVVDVLGFVAPMPGMTVVDMEAGGGIYSELFSRIVGPGGKVYMQSPKEFDVYTPQEVKDARLGKRSEGIDRLPNLTYIKTPFDALTEVADGEADIVTWFMGPHEVWFTPEGEEIGVLGDPEGAFAEVVRMLKPGGHFVVLEHKAAAGTPVTSGGDTHRIDQAIVIAMSEKAGLTLVEESDLLANPKDDYSKNVFDPEVRRQTDRMLLKFVKNNEKNNVTMEKSVGTLEVVAEIDISPGNVAVSNDGRIFSSIHPFRSKKMQLVEITGNKTYVPFPNVQVQSSQETKSNEKFDAPLGIIFDDLNRLWVVDLGLELGYTRLFAYDIKTNEELYRFDIPKEIAPSGSFVQDLVVDEKNGFVYLADVRNPAIIVVDINKNTFRKIVDLPSMAHKDIDIIIDDKVQYLRGKPARIALDPITISADRETLYYGAMNSTSWYQLPTQNIRSGKEDSEIIKFISLVGEKPICDGAATDDNGNHYFTNIQNNSIDVLSSDGSLRTLKKHPFLDWPDSVRVHGDWLYVAANQVHKTPTFTGGEELSIAPYRILKLKYR